MSAINLKQWLCFGQVKMQLWIADRAQRPLKSYKIGIVKLEFLDPFLGYFWNNIQ